MRKLKRDEYEENIGQSDKTVPKQHHTTKEREDYELTHCPYRSWCAICVDAKVPGEHHERQNADIEDISAIEVNCTFEQIGQETPRGKSQSWLSQIRCVFSCLILMARRKGAPDEYVIEF